MSAVTSILRSGRLAQLVPIANGAAVPLADVPRVSMAELQHILLVQRSFRRRVAGMFGYPTGEKVGVLLVLAADEEGTIELVRAELPDSSFPSLTSRCPEVHLFERELAEQWNLIPVGHPWLKPVRYQPSRRTPTGEQPVIGVTNYYAVEGQEVHEVAVGPVHAGVIEPGHFRFQCYGENIIHLEISLGYQHRGVERALVGGPNPRSIHYAETLAGDTSVGHATAYCQVIEALAGMTVPARAQALRAIALELERLANHVGDLGALAGDVGFLPTASFCGRLRGDYLNMTADLCGSRFGRGIVRPGGVRFDVSTELASDLVARISRALDETEEATHLLWSTASVQSRFEEIGKVPKNIADELGAVGVVARASGLQRDIRTSHPSGYYRFTHVPISVLPSGDVFARAFVRTLEIRRSADFIRRELAVLPEGPITGERRGLRADHVAVSLVEGWRGEICHVAMTNSEGRLGTYKVVDPSFHNWAALAMALRRQQISDFPLCNKSFNLSYCGHDL